METDRCSKTQAWINLTDIFLVVFSYGLRRVSRIWIGGEAVCYWVSSVLALFLEMQAR